MAAKDNKDKEAALPEGMAEKPKKKSRFKRFIIIFGILLITLAAGGGAAYWWFYLREPPMETASSPAADIKSDTKNSVPDSPTASLNNARIERRSDLPRMGVVVPLPPITVNLNEPSGRRYLKLGMEVELNADVSAQLKAQNARIRDAIISLLAGKTYGDVASPDGKVLLKAEISARLNQILGAQRVVRVYFTDFVVD